MNKDEPLDLIFKATAVYLFVLAVVALPSVVGALLMMVIFARSTLAGLSGDASFGENLMATGVSTAVSGVLQFVFYILVGRNLFNGGSWIRRIVSTRNATQPNAAVDLSGSGPSDPSSPSS